MAAAPIPLTAATAGFLDSQRSAKYSAHTIKARKADLAVISGHLSVVTATPVDKLTARQLSVRSLTAAFGDFADSHEKNSVSRAWSTWNRFCDHLVVTGAVAGNPMAAVSHPKQAKSMPSALAEDSVTHLLRVIRDGQVAARKPWPRRDYAVITTLAVTGIRASEFLDLTIGQIEGEPGQRQLMVRKGKGDKDRAIPIQPQLEIVLSDYLNDRWTHFPPKRKYRYAKNDDPWTQTPPATPLWANDVGGPLTIGQLEHIVRRAYKAAGINSQREKGALIHALRHTFATRLVENGASLVEVMELLGHSSLQTTQRYLKTRPDHLRSAIAANPAYVNL